MSEDAGAKPTISSSRVGVIASTMAAVLAVLAGVVALNWPEIQLRYHRYYFRRGTAKRQVEALVWLCEHRLQEGATKEEVERVLAEPLERRFSGPNSGPHSLVTYAFSKRTSCLLLLFQDGRFWGVMEPQIPFVYRSGGRPKKRPHTRAPDSEKPPPPE